ncbi:hypothetical protein FCM35_KLT05276 [Carex littledalei]|uniref:Uncharacterized protein n=1 Tax=Carex littledalei TaxID=544730 RepID=A0A833QMS3_9POAL|nr:hypothetical protein FCM35_KLT05276 [Carex littledalei]
MSLPLLFAQSPQVPNFSKKSKSKSQRLISPPLASANFVQSPPLREIAPSPGQIGERAHTCSCRFTPTLLIHQIVETQPHDVALDSTGSELQLQRKKEKETIA